jgi:8-oxo-dGTP pyrophosphatase MutT (NUDIX family)
MDELKKFNNTPNGRIQLRLQTNKENTELDYWICRAVAVVGVVFTMPLVGGIQVLTTKRSMEMRDEAGKYGVPCGYLDWDESGYDGMVREIYEETSLYLPDYEKFLVRNNNKMPFTIHDNPKKDNRQNVSLIYYSMYDFHEEMQLFPTFIEKYTDRETAEVRWMSLIDFYNKYDHEYEWAFRHNETIKEALQAFNKGI